MVANLRCNELRDEALDLVTPRITDLSEEALKGPVENFQNVCVDIIKAALSHYEEFAH